jgi:pullulanase/glycogen debranching enzyme
VKSDFELSEIRKREIRHALEGEFGSVDMVDEPEEWKDIPQFNHNSYDEDDEEYLDFDDGN